ncbi:MAG: hypothetical protein HFH14_00035 [Lachnospiraceae bacterium]|nr:hypothetical protein [Lachnospiraceae bacterium]
MKYSFEEKKRAVSVVSVLIFLCAAGIIWTLSGQLWKDGSDSPAGSVKQVSVVCDDGGIPDGSIEPWQGGEEQEGLSVAVKGGSGIQNAGEAGTDNAEPVREPVVTVHVCGAVAAPGVYELKATARVGDAVDAAGGFKKNAASDYLNLAENLSDGQKIVVYTRKQAKSAYGNGPDSGMNGSGGKDTKAAGSGLININTASKEELMALPGIGESKAADIIAYRESNGRFNSTDELMNIPGIKEGVFSKISDSITV